jgi:L-ascorbate metabolism protein UlaG (beta-lactamase superfamily)
MDREEAAEAVAIIRPKVVVPMHNWGSDLVEFAALVAHKTPGVQVAILEGQDLAL